MLIEEFDYEVVQLIPALPGYWARYDEPGNPVGFAEPRDRPSWRAPVAAWALLGKGRKLGERLTCGPIEGTYSGEIVALVPSTIGSGYLDLEPATDADNFNGVIYDPAYTYTPLF